MKVTMFWHGGSSYACFDTSRKEDAEVFRSIKDAKDAFASYADFNPYRPCVSDEAPEDGGPEAWLFFGPRHPVIGGDYPDARLYFGPRGGVRLERC